MLMETYEEILKKADAAEKELDEYKESHYDDYPAIYESKEYKEYSKWCDLEIKYRPLDKIEFRQPYGFGDKMTLDEFINDCKEGFFTDSDGSGCYGTEDKQTNLPIYPSSIMSGTYRTDFSHVYWFNK